MSHSTAAQIVSSDGAVWACDGGDFVGTAAECDAHVDAQILNADGSVKDWADVTCHGSYEVGGPAWEAHAFHCVHPMSVVLADVVDAAVVHGLDV